MQNFNFKQFRREFAEAVTELEQKHGLRIKLGNITYDDFGFKGKIDVTSVGKDAVNDPEALEKIKFAQNCQAFPNISPDDYGREFENSHGTYVVVGLSPKAHKYPIIAKDKSNGKKYKFPMKAFEMANAS